MILRIVFILQILFSLSICSEDIELLDGDFTISYEGEIQSSGVYSNNSASGNFNQSYVSVNAEWQGKIRAVITANLDKIFQENDVSLQDHFDLDEFIKEAYIEIREVNGTPMAIIVGKKAIAFGQNIQAMPFFENNPIAKLQKVDEVFGLTLDLTDGLFRLFDQAEVSIFESKGGDLKLGSIDGVSVRLTKVLSESLLLSVSHAEIGNSHLDGNDNHERRTSIGLIGESADGNLIGWVEGIFFSNNPDHPNSSFAITAGAQVKVHASTDLVVEYTYLKKELHQIAIGTKTALTKNMTLGLEVRYNYYTDGRGDDIIFGVGITYHFDSYDYDYHEEPLFGRF